METADAASGAAGNANGFCQYLVTNLFAYWRANGAMIYRAISAREIEPLASTGWVAEPEHSDGFIGLVRDHFVRHPRGKVQALYPNLEQQRGNLQVELLQPNCAAILFVSNQPHARPTGGVVVTFHSALDTDEIEQIRRTFPMLRASLNLFLGVEAEPEWAKDYSFSSRQLAILQQILDGINYRDISKALWVSESTIKQEAKRIFLALGVKNRFEAAKKLGPKP